MITAVHLALSRNEPNPVNNPFLDNLLASINKRFFHNRIAASAIWDIPKGTVSVLSDPLPSAQIGPEHTLWPVFQKAVAFLKQQQPEQAIAPLIQCAQQGHGESCLLLSHILKRRNDPRWLQYAQTHNTMTSSSIRVPAACYYPESHTIALHPYLRTRNVPQFVLKYLIYHECCHQIIGHTGNRMHNDAFMDLEYQAPHRKKSLGWLSKEGFPTLENSHNH